MSRDEIIKKLQELEQESDVLFQNYLKIRAARTRLKNGLREANSAAGLDLGCECDNDYCHTEKNGEPISAGETDVYCHDDQDRGDVSVHCLVGTIEVIISTAIFSTFLEYDRKTLRAGDSWKRAISEQDGWYDQTNRVEVLGHANSTYNLDFKSWDD